MKSEGHNRYMEAMQCRVRRRCQWRWEDSDLENNENAVLERLPGVVKVEICETGKESNNNMVEQSSEAVIWGSPERKISTLLNNFQLVSQRSCKFPFVSLEITTNLSQALLLHLRDRVFDVSQLW